MYCTVQWTMYVCKDHPRDQYKVAPKDRWDLYIHRCFTVVEWMQWIMITQDRLSLSRGGL